MPGADVLLVSLGGTAGLRAADALLADSLRRAGARVEVTGARRPREWRTFAAIELAWALNARRAARAAIAEHRPRAVLYSSTTAALLAPTPGAIRFDAPAAGNRPGRHGIWQRPVEQRRFAAAPLLVPWSDGAWPRRRPRRARRRRARPGAAVRRRRRSATSPRSPTAPTRRRRASTACSPPGARRAAATSSSSSPASTGGAR